MASQLPGSRIWDMEIGCFQGLCAKEMLSLVLMLVCFNPCRSHAGPHLDSGTQHRSVGWQQSEAVCKGSVSRPPTAHASVMVFQTRNVMGRVYAADWSLAALGPPHPMAIVVQLGENDVATIDCLALRTSIQKGIWRHWQPYYLQ